jgi:hypothetical protein
MNWKLKLDIWESEDYNRNLEPVISAVAEKMDSLVGSPPVLGYKPLHIVNDLYYGMKIYTPLSNDFYKLGLTVGHLTYGKVAYQFANLLSHLYTDPRQLTWFSQAIAHMASFWFLDYMDQLWKEKLPGDSYKGSEEIFVKLKNEKIKTAYENIDIMLNLASSEWIREEVEQLSNNGEYAPSVVFDHVALELLPLFQEEENSWQLLPWLGKATSKPVKDKSDLRIRPRAKPDFDLLREIVPADLRVLVDRITTRLYL